MSSENNYVIPSNLTLEMVEAKEKELEARRKVINQLQNHIGGEMDPEPNFPPRFLCIKPQIYHNIKEQVPVHFQRFMYTLCALYISLIALIFYNIISAFVNLLLGGSGTHFAVSFLYLLGIPGAFIVWYYNTYCATIGNSNPRRIMAYCGLFVGVCFDVWMAVGLPGLGGDGWIITLGLAGQLPAFVMFLIASSCWTLHGVLLCIMLIRFWRVPSNASLQYQSNVL